MRNEEGKVKDILAADGLTREEIKKKLKEKGVSEATYHFFWFIMLVGATLMWLLPAIAKYTGWSLLGFFSNLPTVEFHIAAVVLGFALMGVGLSLECKASYLRRRGGGLNDVDETIFIVKEGIYRIVRHLSFIAQIIFFPSMTIALSPWIPFTILAIISCALVVGIDIFLIRVEEKLNIDKWGEDYRQYMHEVPAVNFVKGFWNWFQFHHQSKNQKGNDKCEVKKSGSNTLNGLPPMMMIK